MSRRSPWLPAVQTALFALACAGAPPASPAPTADDTPKTGGIFRAPVDADLHDHDVSYTGTADANPYVIRNVYSSLLRFKTGPGIKYSELIVEPSLAQRWEVSPDAATYTFHLRKGVKYTDVPPVNGRELTAADVKWSYEYIGRTGAFKEAKLPASRNAFYFEGLDEIQTPDPATVVVKFREGFAPFLNYAATTDNPIMAREIYEQDGHLKDRIAGTGPFILDSAAGQKGSRAVLKKNRSYFEEGKPYLDEYHLLIIKDESLRQAAFTSRQLDLYVSGRDPTVTEEVRRSVPGAQPIDFVSSPNIMALNFKRPPFDSMKVRLAVSRAIDRDEVVKLVTGGRGGWALAFSNIRDDLFTQQEIKSFVKYDPEESRRLLAEAGYPQGFQAELIFAADDAQQKAAELVQAQLKRVGINLILKPLEATENTRRRRAADCDICWLGEAPRVDPDGQLFNGARARGTANYNQITDPTVEAMVLAQRREGNPEKRTQLLRDVIRHINEHAFAVPTWRSQLAALTHPYVKGYHQNADYRTQGVIRETWLAP